MSKEIPWRPCEHRTGSVCAVASALLGHEVQTSPLACSACSSLETPKQTNQQTIGLAIYDLMQRGKYEGHNRDRLSRLMKEHVKIPKYGVGSILQRYFSVWYVRLFLYALNKKTGDCNCEKVAGYFNTWRSGHCADRVDTMVDLIMESAAKINVKPLRWFVRWSCLRAIKEARELGL